MVKLLSFQSKLDSLREEQDTAIQDFEDLENQMNLKVNNGAGLTEEDVDAMLAAMARLGRGSKQITEELHRVGLEAPQDSLDFEGIVKKAREEAYGLQKVK